MTRITVEEHAKDMAVRLFRAARTTRHPSDWKRFRSFMHNLCTANLELWHDVEVHLSWVIDGIAWNDEGEVIHKRFDDEPMPVSRKCP